MGAAVVADAEHVEPTVARLLGRRPRTMGEYIVDAASVWRVSEGGIAS